MKYEAITVTELNKYIKDKIADDEYLNNVLIKGEISNFKHHYTGHMYFTLKDENSLIKCIMFKGYTANLNFVPKDGTKVRVFGTVSVFERDGLYQVYVKAMEEDGIGDLYKKYQELKQKLEEEGLFEQSRKKAIPFMPKVIGVLTSNTGSVIKDIINVSTRRNPNVYIRLLPVPVQGEGAGKIIANAIKIMNDKKLADVIILARGGGSLEDLWPFNEEVVARAIAVSEIPIISAVGHETDFTIADFVADLRAPTPSAAAELAVQNIEDIYMMLQNYQNRYKSSLRKIVEIMRLKYEKVMSRQAYVNPTFRINEQYLLIDKEMKKIENAINKKLQTEKNKTVNLFAKLDALSPLKTLIRGYGIVKLGNKVVTKVEDLKTGDEIDIRLIDGEKKAKVL